MGVVYSAEHLGLKRRFALKFMLGAGAWDAPKVARFRAEAEALGRLQHPAIVSVSDAGVDPRADGLPYLATELLEGETLDELCRRGPLPFDVAIAVLDTIATAIDFAHDKGVLHRDLKTANVFMCRQGDSPAPVVKLLDFGLARLMTEGPAPASTAADWNPANQAGTIADNESHSPPGDIPTQTTPMPHSARPSPAPEASAVAGTPAYMAPERLTEGVSTRATDIYAFGVIAYALLAGRLPFEGKVSDVFLAHVKSAPPRPSSVRSELPPLIDDALLSALDKDPPHRPKRARDHVWRIAVALSKSAASEWKKRELPRRMPLALALGALAALGAPQLSRWDPLGRLELATVDARSAALSPRPPDPRLVIVQLDEAFVDRDPRPLATRVDDIVDAIRLGFDAGARAAAVDLLLPQSWGSSEAFAQLVTSYPDRITLAAFAPPGGASLVGPEALGGLTAVALGAKAAQLFGVVNIEEDSDGIVRRAKHHYRAVDGSSRDAWATRAARTLVGRESIPPSCGGRLQASYWLDPALDSARFKVVPISRLRESVSAEPALWAGSLVLVGADLAGSGDDAHRIVTSAMGRISVPGVFVQALSVETLVSGTALAETCDGPLSVGLMPVLAGLGGAILCARRLRHVFLAAALVAGIYVGLGWLALREYSLILPLLPPLLAAALLACLSAAIRSKLSSPPSSMDLVSQR